MKSLVAEYVYSYPKMAQCVTPITIRDPKAQNVPSAIINVPCGKCGACLETRRAEWSFRLRKEFQYSLSGIFLTLTYNDENLIWTTNKATLSKRDVQLFIKSIRKENAKLWDFQLRYYAVGEYGSKTQRPHYHILMFNLHPDLFGQIEQIWKKGQIMIGQINDATIHYTTKYHVNPDRINRIDQEDEFALMSTKPAIGSIYLQFNQEWHKSSWTTHVINNGYPQKMPRYYKNKIFNEIERRVIARQVENKNLETYKQEIELLEKSGFIDPENEIFRRQLADALGVRRKSIQNDKF